MDQLFVRIGHGPLLTRRDLPFPANAVFNPGVTEIDGEVVLLLGRATTTDFVSATRLGVVLPPTNKDATIFREQITDNWVLLHRPVTGGQEHIWYSCSESDLFHWCKPGILMPEGGEPWWDSLKIGCGVPPIRTEQGWLQSQFSRRFHDWTSPPWLPIGRTSATCWPMARTANSANSSDAP